MKVLELMTKCANCYYGETKVTICDGDGGIGNYNRGGDRV